MQMQKAKWRIYYSRNDDPANARESSCQANYKPLHVSAQCSLTFEQSLQLVGVPACI